MRIHTPKAAGFTLIEMLVVLMIMGLFVGLVSAITQPDERALLKLEAERLSQLLDFAASEARLTGRYVAWTGEESGYRFWRTGDDGTWIEIRSDELLRPRTLPQGMVIASFRVENMRPQGSMRLEFSPLGNAYAFAIGMAMAGARYSIAGSPVGEIRVQPGMSTVDGQLAQR